MDLFGALGSRHGVGTVVTGENVTKDFCIIVILFGMGLAINSGQGERW